MNQLKEVIEKNKKRQLNIYCNIISKIVMKDLDYYKDKEYAQFFIKYNNEKKIDSNKE